MKLIQQQYRIESSVALPLMYLYGPFQLICYDVIIIAIVLQLFIQILQHSIIAFYSYFFTIIEVNYIQMY